LNIDDESEDEDFDGIDKRHAKDRCVLGLSPNTNTVCPYKTDTSVYPSQRLTSGFRKPRCSRERRRMTKTNRARWTTAEKRARSRTTTTNRWTTDGKQQARRSRTNRRAAKATLRTWAGKPPRGCGTEARRERRGEKVCEVIFTKCVFFQTVLKF
jgi:hypothetical protein